MMTTALSKIHELYARVAAYEALFEESKKTLKAFYISDAPLAERWEAFENCPKSLQANEGWIIHLEGGTGEALVAYDGMFHAERYSLVDMLTVVEHVQEAIDYGDDLPDGLDLDILKEEILQTGVHSFTYDW